MAIYLGMDIGTTSAKCLAVDADGTVLALSQQGYPMSVPRQDWAEQDPEDYWRALVSTVRQCVQQLDEQGRDAGEISALAMSTQGDTLIVTDEHGEALAPAISWMDSRGAAEYGELLAERDRSFWYRETDAPLTALGSACSIRWLSKNRPDLMRRGTRCCYVPDFLARRLVGEFVIDVPSASWTPLFSSARRDWSDEVLELLVLPRSAVSRAVESGETIGKLTPDAARELGLPDCVELTAGAFDQTAAAHGAGSRAGERSVLSCGTAWVLYSVVTHPPEDQAECLCACCHVRSDEWGMVLPFAGGSAYDWLGRTFPANDAGASESRPPVFIPHLYGGLSPDWRPESKGSLLGLTMSHTREDVRLALMRGIACEARRNLEAAEALSGRVENVRMVGGAGKSDIWPQIVSNVLDLPVEVSECVESACYGAAKLAAGEASSRWTAFDDVRVFSPAPSGVDEEQRGYERYLRFYGALLSIYENE